MCWERISKRTPLEHGRLVRSARSVCVRVSQVVVAFVVLQEKVAPMLRALLAGMDVAQAIREACAVHQCRASVLRGRRSCTDRRICAAGITWTSRHKVERCGKFWKRRAPRTPKLQGRISTWMKWNSTPACSVICSQMTMSDTCSLCSARGMHWDVRPGHPANVQGLHWGSARIVGAPRGSCAR